MKLSTLLEKGNTTKGTYAGLRFSDTDNDNIEKIARDLGLPNPIQRDDIHMTLLYSRKYLPNYKPAGEIDEWAYPKEFHVFDTFDKKRALVLMVDCPYAIKRHNYLMKEHKATYDYPEYLTHITLSYDIGDMNLDKIKEKFDTLPKEFHINSEYYEELKLEWKPGN